MKLLACISAVLVVVSSSLLEEADVHFQSFKTNYEKSYINQAEEVKRFAIFKNNLKSMEEHNAIFKQGKITWEKGITQFADWTEEEYKQMLTLQKSSIREITGAEKSEFSATAALPDAIDYREEGQVTEVRNQGPCGASWAFSVAGSIEAAYYRKSGNLIPLSPQELLDCTSEVGNSGCNGGYLHETMPYAQWHGIQSEESYPYIGKDGQCRLNETAVITKIDSFKYFFQNQYELEQVIGTIGPVSASFIGDGVKDYKSGIYGPGEEECGGFNANLALLVVGYGLENGTHYWIAKNCYGTGWGEDGYIRIYRTANYGSCGLYSENVYPIIY